MARKRFITSDISIDERLAEIAAEDPKAALMWPWLLLYLDDWGRGYASAMRIKLAIFPAFPFTAEDIEKSVDLFVGSGLLFRYEADGESFIAVKPRTWMKYQTYLKGSKRATTVSSLPEPPDDIFDCSDKAAFSEMNKPNDYVRKGEKTADKGECQQTNEIVRRQSGLSVPSPSLSPSLKDSKPLPNENISGRCEKSEEAPEPETADSKPYERFIRDKFDAFWEKYPRRVAKKDALKAFRSIFNRRLSKNKVKVLLKNFSLHYRYFLEVQLPNIRDPGYIPYPASWLRSTDFGSPPEAEFSGGVGTADSKANSAWETVRQAAQHKRTVGSVEDRAIHAVIESMGGWKRLEWMPMSSLEGEKENFIRQYRLECTRTKEAVQ